jgi:hypothetical protein
MPRDEWLAAWRAEPSGDSHRTVRAKGLLSSRGRDATHILAARPAFLRSWAVPRSGFVNHCPLSVTAMGRAGSDAQRSARSSTPPLVLARRSRPPDWPLPRPKRSTARSIGSRTGPRGGPWKATVVDSAGARRRMRARRASAAGPASQAVAGGPRSGRWRARRGRSRQARGFRRVRPVTYVAELRREIDDLE